MPKWKVLTQAGPWVDVTADEGVWQEGCLIFTAGGKTKFVFAPGHWLRLTQMDEPESKE